MDGTPCLRQHIDDSTHASFLDQIVAARPVEESTAKDDRGEMSGEDEDSDKESALEYEQGDVCDVFGDEGGGYTEWHRGTASADEFGPILSRH